MDPFQKFSHVIQPLVQYHKMTEEEEGLLRVDQINNGIVLPMVIKTAIELDLFEIMAKTPGGNFSSFDLASSLPRQTQETAALIERILRFLASHSVLTSTVVKDEHGDSKNVYGMTAVSNNYVRKQDGTYYLKDAVVEGGVPFDRAHGVNAFEYPAKDNRFNEVFNKCMYDNTRIVMKMILEKYKGFEGVKTLTDDAPPYPGVEHVGGDMFQSVPKGDVVFMKWILHDWGDTYCIKLLKNCWSALPDCGKVVVVEGIIQDQENDISCDEVSKTIIGGDMIMLIANPGGKERTKKEYNLLAKEAGFTSVEIVCQRCPIIMSERKMGHLMLHHFFLSTIKYHLKDAVSEGGVPFDKAHGVNAFVYPAKDNRYNEVFNKCMYDNTRIVMKLILEKYNGFEGVKELTDVGGGLGVEHVGGDMFQSVPKGDVIFMKWILHDWGDSYCIKLLKNCWAALPEHGKVVVCEVIIPDPESDVSCSDEVSKTATGSDLVMLIANPGGKERTAKEYNALAKEAGFTSMEISLHFGSWNSTRMYHVKDAVIEGGSPFDKAHGVNPFEYSAKDNRYNEVYNKCMSDRTRMEMKMMLEKYKGFEGVKVLIDVGGGLGANLELIVSKYPDIKGINFDLPHHVGGDMFQSVPKGDVIFIKRTLHNWGHNHCLKLLKNCWAALPEGGKVVLIEAIIPDHESHISDEGSKTALGVDMIMLTATCEGKERTAKEFNVLAKESGFTSMEIVCRVAYLWIMEFYKNV
ncbi:hypothetical protein M8C21_005215 [Ambrosia artemisiifolia]|uniref:Uncharacterized protein n=1 Tax=Ambrosia artemisiifolia TaxID=4212 RepID=A0AAD5C6Z3_AMBAR|nr:hypothetical protein M8C21_005215 [Ambrosia artemisiifolia]